MREGQLNAAPKLLIGLLLAGMLTSTALSAQSGPASQPNRQQPLGRGISDQERIAREVRHELVMLPYYTLFDYLGYQVEGNKITLLGEVTNPTLKRDAEDAVKHIEGVGAVDNRIEVLPPNPDDDRIRREVYRAIYGYDGLTRYAWGVLPSIHIIVKNGHVSLVGAVDSAQDKQLAEMRAKSVPGVFSVDDHLAVTNTSAAK